MMTLRRETPRSGKTEAQHRGQSRHTVCSTLKSRVKQVTLVVCVDPWASDGWPL